MGEAKSKKSALKAGAATPKPVTAETPPKPSNDTMVVPFADYQKLHTHHLRALKIIEGLKRLTGDQAAELIEKQSIIEELTVHATALEQAAQGKSAA